jgi:hypothetical protein
VDDLEVLLCRQVTRWRGKASRLVHGALRGHGGEEETREDSDSDPEGLGDIFNRIDFSDGSFH